MAISFPRISIIVDDDRGTGTQGELNALALGFGIHQAWIYTAMFGTTTILPAPSMFQDNPGSSISLVFVISIIVFGLSLLFAAATDQRFLKHYTAKRVLFGAVVLTTVGTFAVFACEATGILGNLATIFAGVTTGIGSAVLLLFWGIAYSRHSAATIVINTAVAIVIAVAVYSFALHVVPTPLSGIFTAFLPLLELPLLWQLTPVSYAVRHAIPIFNPLPVKKVPFAIRLALPTLLFGFALGALRSISTQIILPSSDLTIQLLALFAGGAATVLLMVTAFSLDKQSHWDFLFRPLVPLIVVTLFFLPTLTLGDSILEPLVLLTGYMCFEALMWVFFGEMSQEFRLSPIFVFGVGRGCLALGSLAGSLSVIDPSFLGSLTPFGAAGGPILLMSVMVFAYALLPRVRDIRRSIAPRSTTAGGTTIAAFNQQAEQVTRSLNTWKCTGEANIDSPAHFPLVSVGVRDGARIPRDEITTHQQDDMRELRESHFGESTAQKQADADRSRKSGRFRAQCEAVANRYLLSRRETEVMFLLAKGYNAAYIQDKLCVSKSTAKTHIGHIYRKLSIHSQQELLLLVEEVAD